MNRSSSSSSLLRACVYINESSAELRCMRFVLNTPISYDSLSVNPGKENPARGTTALPASELRRKPAPAYIPYILLKPIFNAEYRNRSDTVAFLKLSNNPVRRRLFCPLLSQSACTRVSLGMFNSPPWKIFRGAVM